MNRATSVFSIRHTRSSQSIRVLLFISSASMRAKILAISNCPSAPIKESLISIETSIFSFPGFRMMYFPSSTKRTRPPLAIRSCGPKSKFFATSTRCFLRISSFAFSISSASVKLRSSFHTERVSPPDPSGSIQMPSTQKDPKPGHCVIRSFGAKV